jgi:CheY-like chemotaxis protein/anti-sigma regulatory factor (Ser/Thr protein kinase)
LLEGCLRNLIDNALKYTPQGGVLVRWRPGAATPATWRIEVRDTGPGIAPAQQTRVFEEFFQIDNPERDRSKGLGLGLSIVQRTVRLLGHRLSLRSVPGRGCCFTLEVPRIAPNEALPVSALLDDGAAVSPLELAVIDDDAMVRDSLAQLLVRWGHSVHQGADVDEVLAQWQARGRPALDAAIVDLRLRAGRTGLEAIAELRQAAGERLPALVITGDTAPDRLRLLVQAGQAWLPKPLMPMRLRSWLQGLAR